MALQVSPEQVLSLAALFLGPSQQLYVQDRLVSYEDANFRITSKAAAANGADGAAACTDSTFVLKIYSAAASRSLQHIQAQHAAMACMQQQGLATNVPVPSLQGPSILTTPLPGSSGQHAVQLLTWAPGDLMGKGPQSPALQHSMGAFMARVTKALAGFQHAGVPQEGPWCMNTATTTIRTRVTGLSSISAGQRQQLLAAADCLEGVLSQLGQLPQQVCHADANEANILVDAARAKVVAIIDWGDMCYCWRAAEVAIAMTYIMLLQPDAPVQAAGHVLAGYLEVQPLETEELLLVAALIQARVALSLTNGLHTVRDNPGNASYLLDTQTSGWNLLTQLQRGPPSGLVAQLVGST